MGKSRGGFFVQVHRISSGTLCLEFQKDTKEKQLAYGLVVLECYLSRHFPKVKFAWVEGKKGNNDLLTFNTYVESLLAIHEICHSDSFIDKSLMTDKPMEVKFEGAYDILASVVCAEIERGMHKELESVLKEVLFDHDRLEFQRFKNLIMTKFKEAGFKAIDPLLSDLIERIDKIDDKELIYLISKKDMMLTHINNCLKILVDNNTTQKIILYNNILSEEGSDNFERINELTENYNKYSHRINTAINKAESVVLAENAKMGRWSPSVRNLYEKIQTMRNYGEQLKFEKISKGLAICDLADNLKVSLDEFFMRKKISELDLAKFKANFARELKGNGLELSRKRPVLRTILKNILIALSGIGLIALGIKITHSLLTEGRATFFFSERLTTSEKYFAEVQEARNLLNCENLPCKTKC